MNSRPVKPLTYFLIALILFSLLGLEFLVFVLTHWVDGGALSQVFGWPSNWYAVLFHWTVTIALWGSGVWYFFHWSKKRGVLSDLVRFDLTRRDWLILAVGVVFVVVYGLIYSALTGVPIPQVLREYRGFQQMYGSRAWIVSLFQNLYYLMEFVLVIMMAALFQRAGEMWFKQSAFPWGSIGLLLTWGSFHLVTNPQGAVGVMVWALVPGIFFVLAKKGFLPVLVIALLGFII